MYLFLEGSLMTRNYENRIILIQGNSYILNFSNSNPDLYANHAEEEMIHFLKPHQVKAYVRRITQGV